MWLPSPVGFGDELWKGYREHDLAEEWLLREQGSYVYGTVGSLIREEALGRAVLDRKLFREHP